MFVRFLLASSAVVVVLLLCGDVARAHEHHTEAAPQTHTIRAGGIQHYHSPAMSTKASTYVSIRIGVGSGGPCDAELGEVHPVKAYPTTTDVHPLPDLLAPGVSVETLIPFDHVASFNTAGLRKEYRDMTWMVSFPDPSTNDAVTLGQVFLDPRIRVGESRFGLPPPLHKGDDVHLHHKNARADGKIPLLHHMHTHPDIHFIRVPEGVKQIALYCRNTSTVMKFPLREQRLRSSFHAQAASGNSSQSPLKQFVAGPVDTQTNIVFLSAGFLASQRQIFEDIVDRISSGMNPTRTSGNGFDDMHGSVPFDRYWNFYNVFSVFQASNEAGATRALKGSTVDNNLRCYHPTTLERAITCNIELSIALASVSPAPIKEDPDRNVIVVIVNTDVYGGSAMYRRGMLHIGHFYRGYGGSPSDTTIGEAPNYDQLKFNSLVKHELGHAFGNLFDEYDIGISEPTAQPLLNCQAPQGLGQVKWQDWVDIRSNASWSDYRISTGNGGFTVAQSPLPVCGYTNYYKPSSNCMMQAVRDYYMCPVCREACTKTILSTPLSYGWPRFPREDGVLLVFNSKSSADAAASARGMDTSRTTFAYVNQAALYLPLVVKSSNHFVVEWRWTLPGNVQRSFTPDSSTGSLALTSSNLAGTQVGDSVVFTAYVTDVTNYMTVKTRAEVSSWLTQNFTFLVKIVDTVTIGGGTNVSVTNVVPPDGTLNVGAAAGVFMFPILENCSSPRCQINFSASPYREPPSVDGLISEYDSWVLYMLGGIGALFILLWLFAWNYYKGKSSQVVRPIFRTNFSGIVRIIRIIMVMAAVLFMLSSVGALGVSAYYYTKTSALGKIIIIAGTVLAFGLFIMAFIGFWAVSYRSKKLVIVNGAVLYFGLTILVVSMALAISIGSQIQDRKSYWNRNLEVFWSNLVQYNSERACAIQGMLQCSGFYLACNTIVQSTEHCPRDCDFNNRQYGTGCQLLIANYVGENYDAIVQVLAACVGLMFTGLLFNFIYFVGLAKLKRDIRRGNRERIHRQVKKNNGSLTQADRYKALFILKSLDDGDMDHLMKEFKRIDTNGDGQLDRQEFVNFFKKALCHTPSDVEIDEIYRVADLDGDNKISMSEFLCLFDKSGKVAQRRGGGKRGGLIQEIDPLREMEIRKRAEKVFGSEIAGEEPDVREMAQKPPLYRPKNQRPPDPENLL